MPKRVVIFWYSKLSSLKCIIIPTCILHVHLGAGGSCQLYLFAPLFMLQKVYSQVKTGTESTAVRSVNFPECSEHQIPKEGQWWNTQED